MPGLKEKSLVVRKHAPWRQWWLGQNLYYGKTDSSDVLRTLTGGRERTLGTRLAQWRFEIFVVIRRVQNVVVQQMNVVQLQPTAVAETG